MMTITNLQRTILMHMPTDGRGFTATQLHRAIYGIKPSYGSLLADRLTRTMVKLSELGYLKRPTDRSNIGLFENYGYRLSDQGAAWVNAERERIAKAAENEGSDVEPWVGAA